MKKIIYIVVALFLGNVAFGQETETFGDIKGKYFESPNNELNKFRGIWNFSNSEESFRIEIKVKKRVYIPKTKHYIDKLEAHFCFSNNSNCILNSNTNKFIISYTDKDIYGDILFLNFKDPISGKRGVGRFKIISTNKVKWEASASNTLYGNNEKLFEIPTNTTLTRN